MKRLIILFLSFISFPCLAQYHFYFGNIHAHTGYSDGNKDGYSPTPTEAYEYAKNTYHFDFLGISEHNHYSYEYSPGMIRANFARGMAKADSANENGVFCSLFGIEFGTLSAGGHILVYNMPGLIGWEKNAGGWGTSNNYDIYCGKYEYGNLYSIINENVNAFGTLCHPDDGDFSNLLEGLYYKKADDAIVGMAIRSGPAFSSNNSYSNPATFSYEDKYFLALSKGYHIGPTIDHDNHYTTFGRMSKGRTVVLARNLHRDSIIAAYNEGRFYASDDWNAELNFTINNHLMGSVATTIPTHTVYCKINEQADTLNFIDNTESITLYRGVEKSGILPMPLISVFGTDSLNYEITTNAGDSFYYFIKATQEDGDVIWSSPIWLKSEEHTPIPSQPSFINTKKLEIYPNPSQDFINVNIDMGLIREIGIYEINGKKVKTISQPRENNIDISNLSNQSYIIECIDKNGQQYTTIFSKI